MIDFNNDERIVLTLDAGGTNFAFSAIQGNKEIIEPFVLPSNSHDLEKCLNTLVEGFEKVKSLVNGPIAAISFAFPGPADYELGIIGNLPNFKAFNGGVPMGPFLENHFNIPVFINNDGSLFAYGEALSGALPEVNNKLEEAGSPKRYKNLVGLTLGTGFGSGIVFNKVLLNGDNSCGAEVHNSLNPFNTDWNAEESVSTRAIIREYINHGGENPENQLMPKDIANIANGLDEGNQEAAKKSFELYGRSLGAAVANMATIVDGLVVIGGGITQGWDLFAPSLFQELNRKYISGENQNDRLSFKMFDLENEEDFKIFLKGNKRTIEIPGTDKPLSYDDMPRSGVIKSKLGASKATWLGAYAYALEQLN